MASFDIHTLDLRFQGAPEGIASFLVVGPGGSVLVESGPGSTLEALKSELARFGFTPGDVRALLVTHIHLDHAGAAGWWAQHGTPVYVHHLGAPHLADPTKLLASAQRIYGDTMKPLWGDFLASPAERLHSLKDGDVVEVAGLKFVAHDTPGHARHHLLYQLGDVAFTGDLAGIRLSSRPYVRLPTPPPEFDLETWLASVARMRARPFARLYLTHFGPADDVDEHWARVEALLPEYAERVRAELAQGTERAEIIERFNEVEDVRQAVCGLDDQAKALYSGVGPIGMSVDGLIRYWNKKQA
jgi:glyoxylase-like metal-dependent hydrolase (beta-lactamase superfamily II)